MNNFKIKTVGKVIINEEGSFIKLEKKYIPALEGLAGFSHINIIWWFSACDDEDSRSKLSFHKPYKNSPKIMGSFATRSPERPNSLALTSSQVISINYIEGIIQLAFIDAKDQTPVLDIKPYTPSFDRVEYPSVPDWSSNWPKSTEESGVFNWGEIFNFS